MKKCAIVPDRGDRPEFLKQCLYYIERQTISVDRVFLINEPSNITPDLTWRVRVGFKRARSMGYEYAFIFENDDYYPETYIEEMFHPGYDFFGIPETAYYNIRTKEYIQELHPGHSSLCFTGFRLDAMKKFPWPHDKSVFLDIDLWTFVRQYSDNVREVIPHRPPLGIKHGTGLCGGYGHGGDGFKYHKKDKPGMPRLQNLVGEDFEFYKKMHHEIYTGSIK